MFMSSGYPQGTEALTTVLGKRVITNKSWPFQWALI